MFCFLLFIDVLLHLCFVLVSFLRSFPFFCSFYLVLVSAWADEHMAVTDATLFPVWNRLRSDCHRSSFPRRLTYSDDTGVVVKAVQCASIDINSVMTVFRHKQTLIYARFCTNFGVLARPEIIYEEKSHQIYKGKVFPLQARLWPRGWVEV